MADAGGLRRAAGFDAAGGILTRGNAQVDPYGACMAFARAAGGPAHTCTSTRGRAGSDSVAVASRSIPPRPHAAQRVVIATGYARRNSGRWPDVPVVDTYVVATPPLDRAARAAIGLRDVMLWTPSGPITTHGGRTTIASCSAATIDRTSGRRRRPRSSAGSRRCWRSGRLFPRPAAWLRLRLGSLFATTPDGLPYIGTHRRYPRHLFALGYGGNGMTFGFLAAQIIERLFRGKAPPEDALFRLGRMRSWVSGCLPTAKSRAKSEPLERCSG